VMAMAMAQKITINWRWLASSDGNGQLLQQKTSNQLEVVVVVVASRGDLNKLPMIKKKSYNLVVVVAGEISDGIASK